MVQPDRARLNLSLDYHSVSTTPFAKRAFCAIAFAAAVSACGAAGEPEVKVPEFDPSLAWAHLGQQLAIGPRISGYKRHDQALTWLIKQLEFRADTVETQNFTGPGLLGKPVTYENVVARWRPELRDRVLLVTHWDSAPYASRDPDESNRRRPVPGANEGASGTAVLLELAQLLHETAPSVGVDIVFTDAMERGEGKVGLGARQYVQSLPAGSRPRWAVYVDRVGDRDLRIPMEGSSADAAPALVQKVWAVARDAGKDSVFVSQKGAALEGDHRVLAAAGIPTAAIIDPEYGRGNELWRTVDDNLDNVSRESLGVVGTVLANLVYREQPAAQPAAPK